MSSNLTTSRQILSKSYLRLNDELYAPVNKVNIAPRMMIFGTSERGITSSYGVVNRNNVKSLPRVIGRSGDLLEQVNESMQKGEEALAYMRIGAKSCYLEHIGGTAGGELTDGYRVVPVQRGEELGTRLAIAYDATSGRMIVQDSLTKVILFDNNPSDPIDLGEILVTGTPTLGSGTNIGTISPLAAVALSSATAADAQLNFYAGYNGTQGLSRMELFQECFRALKLSEGLPVPYYAAPEKATLNAPWSTENTATGGTAFPAARSQWDSLGNCYIELDGDESHVYWDVDNDNAAEFWSVNDTGDYSGTSKLGHVFSASSFTRPNFAYLYAAQMYFNTVEHQLCQAGLGVEPPALGQSIASWLGNLPVFSTNEEGNVTVATDGSGILGHKYLVGATDYRSAAAYGGMPLTDALYFDSGVEQKDDQGNVIDIGKHIFIWGMEETFPAINGVRGSLPYAKISPAAYVGWRRGIPAGSSPSQSPYPMNGSRMLKIGNSYHEALKLSRITFVRNVPGIGTKVTDAPTASLIGSPYRRQGIMEITLIVNNKLRGICNNYIGRYVDGKVEAALNQDLQEGINFLKTTGVIIDGAAQLEISPEGRRLGFGNVIVALTLPFELEQIFISVSVTF